MDSNALQVHTVQFQAGKQILNHCKTDLLSSCTHYLYIILIDNCPKYLRTFEY